MDFFDSYRIEHDREGYTIILYLNTSNSEFSDDLGHIKREKCADLYSTVQEYVNNKFPNLKVTTVKVMLGSMLLALIPLGPKPVKAVEAGTAQTVSAAASSYTTYSVISGDNLWNIATKFKSSVSDIKVFNRLTSDVLKPGQTLRIPNGKVYTIAAGDTLWGISRSFGVTVDALKSYNSLTSDTVFLGQNIVIPPITATTAIPSVTPNAPAPSQGTASGTPYTVVAGDTLWGLASRFGLTVDALRSYNHLTTDLLSIGQRLVIPPTPLPAPAPAPATNTGTSSSNAYTVVAGDTLWTLSKTFNVSVDYLKSFNNLETNTLYIGQVLRIPSTSAPSGTVTPTPAPTGGSAQGTTPSTSTTVALPSNIPPELRGAAPTITYVTHTVVSGDNVWNLAIKYGIPSYELLRANNLTESSMLTLGQVLKVPVHNIPAAPTMGSNYGELLDWWTEAQYVFPINKVARVIDLRSGRSFYVKRTIGANHSDTEPLTATDSAVIKEVWGGTYAWSAHPVIVEVDGRRIAAAMYSMPHGIEYILDNNFSGHFDIHFLNSTRHADGLTDQSMQDAVRAAAGLKSI